MAIYPLQSTGPRTSVLHAQPAQHINILAWTEQATESLQALPVPPAPATRGTSAPLSTSIDEHAPSRLGHSTVHRTDPTMETRPSTPRQPLLRRDSLDRRNALLKGKEGSRRRQRWENDHLLSNPHAQAPLPSDFEVHPTHPRRSVPYFLAPLWDAEIAGRHSAIAKGKSTEVAQDPAVQIPHTLRATLKRAKAAKGLLQDLETDIRKFVISWEEKKHALKADGLDDVGLGWNDESEDEEIVFVGRGGRMLDVPASPKVTYQSRDRVEYVEETEVAAVVRKEKLVFDSLASDRGASFGRWLVHSIATYYDLQTWSVTVGDPARREAYVGIKLKAGRAVGGEASVVSLPRPLWGMV